MPLELDARRTALAFLDFQVDVCAPGGRMVSQDPAVLARFADARSAAARLLSHARSLAGPAAPYVLHVCHRFARGFPELEGAPLNGMSRAVRSSGAFEEGSAGAAFVPELAPRDGEPVLVKTSISPFETTDLGARLSRRGIERLVLAGVVTHYAVLGAALAANDRGYRVVVARDACASGDPARHETALAILGPLVELATVDELVAALQPA